MCTLLIAEDAQDDYLGSENICSSVFAPNNAACASLARELSQYRVVVDYNNPDDFIAKLCTGPTYLARVDNGELPNMIQFINFHLLFNTHPLPEIERKPVWETLAEIKLCQYERRFPGRT